MTRAAGRLGLAAIGAVASLTLANGACAAALAPTTAEVAMTALMEVCRPAAQQDLPASTFAARLGYAADAELPPGLPISRVGAQSWRVPMVAGEVHVVSGAMPEPAQRSACMVAVYNDPVPGLDQALNARLTAPDVGFERDSAQSFTTDKYRLTHYDSHWDYLVRNVMTLRPVKPRPGSPSFSIIAYRVDYSWLKSTSP